MKDMYYECPICGGELDNSSEFSVDQTVVFNCDNEKEIILAKARREPIPEYHAFSYNRRMLTGVTTRWMLRFSLSPKKSIRMIRRFDVDYTVITDRYGTELMTIDQPLEPDFPNLEKLKHKVRTYMTFS